MVTLEKLYNSLHEKTVKDVLDPRQLNCLLEPGNLPPVWRKGPCDCEEADNARQSGEKTGKQAPCEAVCPFDAISRDDDNNGVIDGQHCTGCGLCLEACACRTRPSAAASPRFSQELDEESAGKADAEPAGRSAGKPVAGSAGESAAAQGAEPDAGLIRELRSNLAARKDLFPVLELLQQPAPVYALVAPAFIGQFDGDTDEDSAGRLRAAFKSLGFAGMVEVALFADILTLKEALEFDEAIKNEEDYLLTSCCCPVWLAMIRKKYAHLISHIPPSVSPMIAAGRTIKQLLPEAKTVFVGPCLAKKAEAREPDLAGAIDHVLTFKETAELFREAEIIPADFAPDARENTSAGGRIYAVSGGVSQAVRDTLSRLRPGRKIPLKAKQADGVAGCKALLEEVQQGLQGANFIEGMGCNGGCAGGPAVLTARDISRPLITAYSKDAPYETPADNPFVLELLENLGIATVENLRDPDNLFHRKF
ncbi:MAG: [Fe-Fe] hydrogenase large subunit C-terminal domain-containing protein [Clostridiales bacterium]